MPAPPGPFDTEEQIDAAHHNVLNLLQQQLQLVVDAKCQLSRCYDAVNCYGLIYDGKERWEHVALAVEALSALVGQIEFAKLSAAVVVQIGVDQACQNLREGR